MNINRTESLPYKILLVLASVGALSAIAIAPNLTKLIGPSLKRKWKDDKFIPPQRISHTIWRLKDRGLVTKNAKGKLELTAKGKKYLARYQVRKVEIKKPRRWDKKWRVVAFDVFETRRQSRDLLRKTLQRLGFVQLQASLWVYPYDCEEVVGLLRTDLKLSPAIQYMVVGQIDRDRWLRQHFNLLLK